MGSIMAVDRWRTADFSPYSLHSSLFRYSHSSMADTALGISRQSGVLLLKTHDGYDIFENKPEIDLTLVMYGEICILPYSSTDVLFCY